MIRTDNWQRQTIEEIQKKLFADQNVAALALFGSAALNRKVDTASDLDFLIVVNDEQFSQFFPNTEWLKPFGELYAFQQFANEFHGTIRTCFFDFRRIDFVVTTPSRLEQLVLGKSNPLWQGVQVLFSHSSEITEYLTRTWQPPLPMFPSETDFEGMVNTFWFKAMLAAYKVLRDDRLIATHLALDLVRDCCVLGMILRDRTTGTNIHHGGGEWNVLIDSWETPLASYSASGILDCIEKSANQFDQLAHQWLETYREKRYPLLEWLEYIRKTIDKKINSSQSEPDTTTRSQSIVST